MHLSILLISIIVVRWYGAPQLLQPDGWVKPWWAMTAAVGSSSLRLLVSLGLPLVLVVGVLSGLAEMSGLLAAGIEFAVIAALLFYSIGRHDFPKQIEAFTRAVSAGELAQCQRAALDLGVANPAEERSQLYHQVLLAAGYRSLERTFVVLFWFAILGPLLPLAYRLLHLLLAEQNAEDKEAAGLISRCLWVFEWPVVRLMSLSFALTGNFLSCVQRWQDSLLCFKTPSDKVLGNAIGGALNIDVDCQLGCEDIDKELLALKSLLFRTSLFWLCLLAVYILVLL